MRAGKLRVRAAESSVAETRVAGKAGCSPESRVAGVAESRAAESRIARVAESSWEFSSREWLRKKYQKIAETTVAESGEV